MTPPRCRNPMLEHYETSASHESGYCYYCRNYKVPELVEALRPVDDLVNELLANGLEPFPWQLHAAAIVNRADTIAAIVARADQNKEKE